MKYPLAGDLQNKTTAQLTANPRRPESEWTDADREVAAQRAAWDQDIADIETAITTVSPALSGQWSKDERQMVIVSGELFDHDAGKLRVTFIGKDGPHGHVTVKDHHAAAKRIRESLQPPYSSMTDDDVIAWTSTREFVKGSKLVAFMQADNLLRYLGSKARRGDEAREISLIANHTFADGFEADDDDKMDAAIATLTMSLAKFPTPNPRRALVRNPPWVTKALADSYETLESKVPPRWLPQLASVEAARGSLVADLLEYGCGAYGCVLATLDPGTVLKVTSDEYEAKFAAELAGYLAAPVCVEYKMVVRVAAKYDGRQIHLLWRESAEHVGDIDNFLDRGHVVERAIDKQHRAGQKAFDLIHKGAPPKYVAAEIAAWLEAVDEMGKAVPELALLAKGLTTVWHRDRVLFGDIHAGNLGLVTRGSSKLWVITDPGNVTRVS